MLYQPSQLVLNGKYRIDAFEGKGAFTEVYCATNVTLQTTCALKVLHRQMPGGSSTDFQSYQRRFQLEASLGIEQQHPNLIQVFDFEQDGDALTLVMEYAPGGSLADRLLRLRHAGEVMPVDEVLKVALDVTNGLAALHSRDIVHRNLKPSNILFDAQGTAKVTDLGLAAEGPHPATPAYMSPEQESTAGDVCPSSDIFSLGCVLFEALTGRPYKVRGDVRHTRARSSPGCAEIVGSDRSSNAARDARAHTGG